MRRRKLADPVLCIAHQPLHELLFNVLKHRRPSRHAWLGGSAAISPLSRGSRSRFSNGGKQAPTQEGVRSVQPAKQLVRSADYIRITSAPGRGSRVTILPLQTTSTVTTATGYQAPHTDAATKVDSPEDHNVPIRILLVDDHQIMRQGLRSMLESEPGFEIAAEAMDGEMAVELAASVCPDVVLMDINMPKLNGMEATRRIKHRFPDIAVIGLSMHEDPKMEQLMYEAGAAVYLSKGAAFNIVCDTIRQVRSRSSSMASG